MNQTTHDSQYLVIGGGPAGLQMGYFLERSGRDYRILERGGPGEFFKVLPRHRQLISINKRHTGYDDRETNLRWDWNSLLDDERTSFLDYSRLYFPHADDLVRYLEDYAETHQLEIESGRTVTRVSRPQPGGRFEVETAEGPRYRADRVIVATGVSRPYLPPVPGIETAENYIDVDVDPESFAGQRVLIVGKGNSAFELAHRLIETAAIIHVISPRPLQLAWKTHHVGHLRALNNDFLDTYQLKCQNAVLDGTIEELERDGDGYRVTVSYTHAEGEREVLSYDRVVAATGFRFDPSPFDESCRPGLTLDDRFPALTPAWESLDVPDLYFGGTLMQSLDFKKAASSFIHGFRYNLRALDRLLGLKYHGEAWPSRPVGGDPAALADAALARLNRSSALWQQFGFLGDVVLLDGQGGASYYEELPVAWVPVSELFAGRDYFVVTLEFGSIQGDPFNVSRNPDPGQAERSTFLHPVVRHWVDGHRVGELHLLENLYGEWKDDEIHRRPLLAFFEQRLARAA